jgi:signal transduction histidine kinase
VHAENINRAGDGVASAVEKQMKSEHFKTELITNVSHDIKTPLTSIINYVDLLQKENPENETEKEYLEVLARQSARLKKLIEDLMEASKASTGNLAVNFETCDARVLLTQIVGEFEEKTAANQLELIVDNPKEALHIRVDSRHIWRVFDNLLGNICKYAQPGTRVYISLVREGGDAVISFKNISKYRLNITSEELMERFVRGDSSRNTEGSGLGLSIAQSLTNLMNGTMELSVDGDLFKVVLRFPVV